MVKQVKLYGVVFYKNEADGTGAMADAIKECNKTPGNIVIMSHPEKEVRKWSQLSPAAFLKLMQPNRGLYEVIHQYPHKVYFDIDKKGEGSEDYLQTIKDKILKYFPGAEMAVSGSITAEKTSYHIALQNYVIRNTEDQMYVKHTVKHMCTTEDEAFDWKVYNLNRNMKVVNQAKHDGRVQAIIENKDIKAHLITCFVPETSMPFLPMAMPVQEIADIEKAHAKIDLSTLPKMKLVLPEELDIETASPLQLLQLMPLDSKNDHAYTHRVARFAFGNGLNFSQFMSWLQHKHETITTEIRARWSHHWDRLHAFPGFDVPRFKMVLANFYPEIKKDMFYRKFAKTFEFDKSCVHMIDTISQAEFRHPEKYCILNVGMGGGKTAQTVNYLRPNKQSFCWIAPNKALAHNTVARLETENVKCDYYLNHNASSKATGSLDESKSMVIVANSMHYLGKEKTYDVVVIDEIETLLDKWFGNFMQHKASCWAAFKRVIRGAKKVILLDAFITTKTLNFIRDLEPEITDNIRIFERNNEKTNRTINYISSIPLMHQNIVDDLNKGLKLFIFYPLKKESKSNATAIAMKTLYDYISETTGKKGLFYNADVDEQLKAGLKNVNESWGDNQFIITNTIITCGVNYDREDFDSEYLFIATFNSPRDIIQVSYRPRHIRSGLINVCYLGKGCQTSAWETDVKDIDCPVYTSMTESILCEKKSPLRKTFQLFCQKAHYSQKTDARTLSKAIEKDIWDSIHKFGMSCNYKDIADITYEEAGVLENMMFEGVATMDDKIKLQKYFFKERFLAEAQAEVYLDPLMNFQPVSVLEYTWDNRYHTMFTQMERLFLRPNNVFAKIQECNGLDSIFPSNMKTLKLSAEITAQIFEDFKFKYLTEKSTVTKLSQEIYNSYFSIEIIRTETENKRTTYHCDANGWTFFYDFVTKYSKRNPDNEEGEICRFDNEGEDLVDIA